MTYWYLTRQRQQQAPDQKVPETPEQNPGTPPRVVTQVVTLVTQEEVNHMSPTIPIVMHIMSKKIEDERLPRYLINTAVDPETVAPLQYNDLIHSKDKKYSFGKMACPRNLGDSQMDYRENSTK